MKKRTAQIGCGLIVLWMLLPMISVLVAYTIADVWNCQVDEGGVHPCVVAGQDIGEALYTMGVMGWFFFLTFPSGLVALIVLLIVVLVARARRKQTHDEMARTR